MLAPFPRVGVDVGGTFTDLAAWIDGKLHAIKVPTVPEDQSAGVAAALARAALPGDWVLAHGTTAATNALLERRGARTALVATEGFADVIEIARQARADLYDLSARRPPPLVPRELRFTVRERVGPQGIITPLAESELGGLVERLAAAEVEAVAVCLLFSFVDDRHERVVGRVISDALPHVHVSLSSTVLPEFREYERTSTTVADAFLGPEMGRYLRRLHGRVKPLGAHETQVMQSSGGVASIAEALARPAALVLSGPAGGVVGAARAAQAVGMGSVLTLDIGGTSADVAAILDGELTTTTEQQIAGVDIRLPMLDVHTISAGGGSIAWIDNGGFLRVGPHSAGAAPGPACYQRGGKLPTVTDANLLLGYLPDGGKLGEDVKLSAGEAEAALQPLADQLGMSTLAVAAGVIRIADHAVAQALRQVTVARGSDPRHFGLVGFGGAGGLHACRTADEIGITRVLIPPAAGVLSAFGLAVADVRLDTSRALVADLDDLSPEILEDTFRDLEAQLRTRLPGARLQRRADLRYRRQAHELTVEGGHAAELRERFHAAHAHRYGFRIDTEPVELVAVRVAAIQPTVAAPLTATHPGVSAITDSREVMFDGEWQPTMVLVAPAPGTQTTGPAIVEYSDNTCIVPPGWRGRVHETGGLLLERAT